MEIAEMEEIRLLANSSTEGKYYEVIFCLKGNTLSVTCNCMAGVMGIRCRHKTALLAGSKKMLKDPGQSDMLEKVVEWADKYYKEGPVGKWQERIQKIEAKIAELEEEKRWIKEKIDREIAGL